MNILSKKILYFSVYLIGITLIFLAFFLVFQRYDLVYNTSASYPLGVYQRHPINREIKRGDLVLFCLSKGFYSALILDRGYLPSGSCESGFAPLLKRVYALGGDHVVVKEEGIRVNGGEIIHHSRPMVKDLKGRWLPLMDSGIVTDNYYAVLSDHHPRSFDSRYFGTIHRDDIAYFAKPIWIMGEIDEYQENTP